MAYAGFDRADCPDLATMARLKTETNLVWCGYYLHAPSQPASTWIGKRAALVAQGWGLAPIFVGQQVAGPGSRVNTAGQGTVDGRAACADMTAEGFPTGSYVYLDLEVPMPPWQEGYVSAWATAVVSGGFKAGIYCSFLSGPRVAELLPRARVWVYHVPTTSPHAVGGTSFTAPEPKDSGFADACVWQDVDEARLSALGWLACDLDSSTLADPSAPDEAVVASAPAPAVAPAQVAPLDALGRFVWIQSQLKTAGFYHDALDGDFGLLSQQALLAALKGKGI